jgi:hypothetical protein
MAMGGVGDVIAAAIAIVVILLLLILGIRARFRTLAADR